MHKILYLRDKSSPKKLFLPFSCDESSSLKNISLENYPIIVFDQKFLRKRKKIKLPPIEDKVCFIHFSRQQKPSLETVQKLGFFDFFAEEDTKDTIAFKLQRANQVVELKKMVSNLEHYLLEKNKRIEEMTLVDPLTGCYNWRYFLTRTQQELNLSRRHLYSVSFIGIDIDNFHNINEIYGVEAADEITKELAGLLNAVLRKEDVLSRWRGDEFFIIAPHLDNKNIYKVTQRIKDKIDSCKFKYKDLAINIKVSIAAVTSPEDNIFNARDVISSLSKCFNSAKRKGGGTIIFYSQAHFKPEPKQLERADAKELRAKIEKMNLVLDRDLMEMIYGFACTIEAKDSYTGKHVENTSIIAERIAQILKLPESEIENIRHAAVLHDLGKIGIDERILSKKGPLTAKEREAIKAHPSIAAGILREIHSLRGSVPAVLYHHERFDGKGYPLGLKGEEIPLSARIVGIADVYQALTSDRPYRKAYPKNKALEIIRQESGRQFDPKIVEAFLKVIDQLDEKV